LIRIGHIEVNYFKLLCQEFLLNPGDPSLSLRMTAIYGIREGEEMAIR